ncbi:ABC transporter permease [bacterium]|nr:ABC transporter permease [bacterium]
MFRLFLKLNIFGRIIAELLLLVFFVCLFFPIFPALGILNPADNGLNYKHFMELLSKNQLGFLIEALIFSFSTGYLCTLLGFFVGYLSHRNFTGKFFFLSLLSFFLIIPESLQFMIASPVLALMFKAKGPMIEITYLSSFLFLTTISIFCTYALMSKISQAELETMSGLGASPMQVFTKYVFPQGKKMVIYLGFILSIQVMVNGTHTTYIANPAKHTFAWNLSASQILFNDLGIASSSYAVLLLFFLLSIIPAILLINKEFSQSKISAANKSAGIKTSSRKKVTRKLPKKKKEKKVVLEKTEPIQEEEPENSSPEEQDDHASDASKEAEDQE